MAPARGARVVTGVAREGSQAERVCQACGHTPAALQTPGACPSCGLTCDVAPGDEPAPAVSSPALEMLLIAAPTVATMMSYTLMQFVDGLLVSRIEPASEVYVAAQGNGGIAAWLAMSGILGTLTVVNTFVAQHLGAGRPREGARYAWAGLWMCAVVALALVPLALAIPAIYRLVGHRGLLLESETAYAQVLLLGAFFTAGARGMSHYFFGLHRPMIVLWSVLAGNVVNALANLALIFGGEGMRPTGLWAIDGVSALVSGAAGSMGVPAMGMTGAALGTVAGAAVEFVIPLAVFLGPRSDARYGTRGAWRCGLGPVRDIVRLGWPGGAMLASEIACWSLLLVWLLGEAGRRAGEDPDVHNAAGWIALRYMHLSFMPTMGLSIAVTAMVGRCMGMGRPDLAARRAWLGTAMAVGYMGACGLAFVLLRRPLIGLFVPDALGPAAEDLFRIGGMVLMIAAVFQVFDGLSIIMTGALRGAGDTVWPGVLTVALSWACIVGGGLAAMRLWPSLGSAGPWLGTLTYFVLLGTALLARFIGGSWRRIRLVGAGV